MDLAIATAFVLAGFLLLMWSADLLVDNASELASNLGVSTLLVGIVIVGFGTSAPELFVSAMAAFDNKGNLALGNALGSNITNIGLVLGSAALVRTLTVERSTATRDLPLVVLVGLIAVALVADGTLTHLDGVILLVVLVAYLVWSVVSNTEKKLDVEIKSNKGSNAKPLALTVVSIAVLMGASELLVTGAVQIASFFGVSELVIGLTIVAIGTSLPELAAAIAAARKGVHDMILGNIIGSNVFNTLGVLGITGAIQVTNIEPSALSRDFPVMLTFTVVMLLIALFRTKFGRREGAILVGGYVAYLSYIVLGSV